MAFYIHTHTHTHTHTESGSSTLGILILLASFKSTACDSNVQPRMRTRVGIQKPIKCNISVCVLKKLSLGLAKSWLIGKDSDAGRDWGQEEKGTTEDEMTGWHHWLDGPLHWQADYLQLRHLGTPICHKISQMTFWITEQVLRLYFHSEIHSHKDILEWQRENLRQSLAFSF